MPVLKAVLLFVGILLVLVGLVWLGQGLGLIPFTATPVIMNLRPWTYAGIAVVIGGLAVILISRRISGRR